MTSGWRSRPRSDASDGVQDAAWAAGLVCGLDGLDHGVVRDRGRITKQGSRLVRWAAVEGVQRLPAHTRLGARRGRNIGVADAARELTGLVFYGLRDHYIRALSTPTPAA